MSWRLPYVGYFLFRRGRGWVVLRHLHRYFVADLGFPFQQSVPQPKHTLLITGDSTAVGIGASRPDKSLSGLFAQAHPDWTIIVEARNGLFLHQLPSLLARHRPVDTVMLVAGGNDILQGISPVTIRTDIERSVHAAQQIAQRVMLICQGNLGNIPLFSEKMRQRLEKDSRIVRAALQETAKQHQALFVDLFYERSADPWAAAPDQFYSDDLFHPGDSGYQMWFEKIQKALD